MPHLTLSWNVTRLEDVNEDGEEAHILPNYELHTVSPDCFCNPKRLDDVDVFPIWLHRDKLDRERPSDAP